MARNGRVECLSPAASLMARLTWLLTAAVSPSCTPQPTFPTTTQVPSYDLPTETAHEPGRLTLQVAAFAPEPAEHARLGSALAVSANMLVIGAPQASTAELALGGFAADTPLPSSGTVYVFVRTTSGWRFSGQVKPHDAKAHACFGASVALDDQTLVVGAPGCLDLDGENPPHGVVHVFEWRDDQWQQRATLSASAPFQLSRFGEALAIDGNALVVAGTHFDESAHRSRNTAHVFARTIDGWLEEAALTPEPAIEYGSTAPSVAIDGDTLVFGTPSAIGVGRASPVTPVVDDGYMRGSVHVFKYSAGHWVPDATLVPHDVRTGDELGCSVAIDNKRIVVGACGHANLSGGLNDVHLGAGAAYVFERNMRGWHERASVESEHTEAAFGTSVALVGNVIVVGAPVQDAYAAPGESPITSVGAVHLFALEDDQMRVLGRIDEPQGANGDGFGTSLAVRDKLLAVGAPGHDGTAIGLDGTPIDAYYRDSGAAYLFE